MLKRFRATVARLLRRRLGFPLEELALARLRKAGLAPRSFFDVGASDGVFANLAGSIWPDAEIHCFEPEPEYVEQLAQRAKTNPRLHVCAALVGSEPHPGREYHFHLGASSVLPNAVKAASTADNLRSARMITLDGYCREHRLSPDFLKIDVQGYELEVLKGAVQVLGGIEVVFTEVNHIAVYEGAPLAAELIGWLADRGYALHDVCNFMPRPRDGALWQTDMVFVRHDSPLRASQAW
jgi:FkbM family methyltransferase